MNRHEYRQAARHINPRGSKHYAALLNEDQVAEILKARQTRERLRRLVTARYSNAALAQRFGVSERCIERALAGETWSHVPDR